MDDPSTAPKTMFTDAQIKSALNVRYLELREKARFVGDGSGKKIAYETGVNGTYLYNVPADFVRMTSVHIDLDGGNLSSLAPNAARIRILKPTPFENAWDAYQAETLTDIEAVSIFNRQYAILAPVDADAAGTNSIRLVYEAATAEMTGDTDEPTIARPFHDVISRLAAVDLLATKNMENSIQTNIAFARMREFELAASEELWSPDSVAFVAGLDDQDDFTQRQGTIDW
jgi:hypothetical protein